MIAPMTNSRGYSIIGLLLGVTCMFVLSVIMLKSLNTAMRGSGSVLPGTVTSFEEGLAATVAWYRDNREWWGRIRSGEYLRYYEEQYGRSLGDGASRAG